MFERRIEPIKKQPKTSIIQIKYEIQYLQTKFQMRLVCIYITCINLHTLQSWSV